MKKLYILLIFCLYNVINAQIFIKDNTSIFAKKIPIYIKKEVNISTLGNIYLREEAQLLQGNTASSFNTGAGKISVFQEGTSDAYQYNYWCSPIGNSSASIGNENFGITMINRASTLLNSTPALTTVHGNYNGISNPLEIDSYWIYKFLYSSTVSSWTHVGNATAIAPGEGFTMKGTSGTDNTNVAGVLNNPDGKHQRYDFRGKPNNGDISISLLTGQYTLTGNPYPSAIDLSAFLFTATNSSGAAYFWETDRNLITNSHNSNSYVGGYGTFSPISLSSSGIYVPATFFTYDSQGNPVASVGSGISYERRYSPIGQGFLLLGTASGTATMKNQFRTFVKEGVANLSQFDKNIHYNYQPKKDDTSNINRLPSNNLVVPQIRIKTIIGINGVQTDVLAFDPSATDGVDFAMDAPSPRDPTEAEMYFLLNNSPYIISVIDFNINKRIPIGFRNTQSVETFKTSVDSILNFTGTSTVFIHDKISDIYYDIVNSIFQITMPAGDNSTQYEITFTTNPLSINENSAYDFEIYQNNQTKSLNILNPKNLNISSLSIYDISGKLILNKLNLGINQSYKISTLGLPVGIYIAKLITVDGKKETKKISIF